jgi:hypothetical protein
MMLFLPRLCAQRRLARWLYLSLLLGPLAQAQLGTTVKVSEEFATSIAQSLFPITVKLEPANLFLTDPTVTYIDGKRIGLRSRFQAYDHRPAQDVAMSEIGHAMISGELDYDTLRREILLHNPHIDTLVFDRKNSNSQSLSTTIRSAWTEQVQNPLRSKIPPHPYVIAFKDNIRGISYDGQNINLHIAFETLN